MGKPTDKKREWMPTVSPLQALFWPESEWLRRERRIEKVQQDIDELREIIKKINAKKASTKKHT